MDLFVDYRTKVFADAITHYIDRYNAEFNETLSEMGLAWAEVWLECPRRSGTCIRSTPGQMVFFRDLEPSMDSKNV